MLRDSLLEQWLQLADSKAVGLNPAVPPPAVKPAL
jgi:hypothetical protein